jgi:LacI family transcriptional regulator
MVIEMALLNKRSTVPLYAQLKVELIKLIDSGIFKSNGKFYTLSEIIEKYNVSLITASRVINELAADGYIKTSRGKRAVLTTSRAVKNPSEFIKVAIFFYSKSKDSAIDYGRMPWTNMIFSGIQEKLLEHKALWSMVPAENSDDALAKLEQLKSEHNAFICLSPKLEGKIMSIFEKIHCPYVSIHSYKNPIYNFVAADYYKGSAEIAQLAIQKKYKSFLYLFNDKNGDPEKMRGFLETLLKKDIPPQNIFLRFTGRLDEKRIREVFENFIKEQGKDKLFPLAVYSFGDKLSMPVLAACHKLGFKVPNEVGIAGSTGIPEAEHCIPPLTTIQTPMRKMGNVAAEMILEMLRTNNYHIPGVKLDVKLLKRESL